MPAPFDYRCRAMLAAAIDESFDDILFSPIIFRHADADFTPKCRHIYNIVTVMRRVCHC